MPHQNINSLRSRIPAQKIFSILVSVAVIIGIWGVAFFLPQEATTTHAQSLPKEPDFYLQIPIGNLTKITTEEFASGRSIPKYMRKPCQVSFF